MAYDSTADTQEHIDRVRELLKEIHSNLAMRGHFHDASKLEDPEKAAFDVLTPRLKGLSYGSEEYRASLREMQPAIQHHYEHNNHHPEHYKDGITGMSLLDLVEMLCDWKAAGERHTDGDMGKSLAHNQERFGIAPQLQAVLENTCRELGWI